MIRNERLKLLANFVNAIGLGLIAIAVLRPIIEIGSSNYGLVALWGWRDSPCMAFRTTSWGTYGRIRE